MGPLAHITIDVLIAVSFGLGLSTSGSGSGAAAARPFPGYSVVPCWLTIPFGFGYLLGHIYGQMQ